ncbi:DUF3991 and TOPRIM domain-containing protein [Phycisphaerales bacterium ac7]
MDRGNDELRAFKTEINLSELTASFGYRLDRKSSSRNSVAMVHPGGDKLIVSRTESGCWVYLSVRDFSDNGTVIDFVQRRTGENLSQVRERLRDWLGASGQRALQLPENPEFAPTLRPITRDLEQVRARYDRARPLRGLSRYLVEERCIPVEVLALPIFRDRIRVDAQGRVLFPHQANGKLTGFEVRGVKLNRFATGGIKGLWTSVCGEQDARLVLAESALDALAYAAVVGHERTRFASIAGQLNRVQPRLILAEIRKLPANGGVVLAMDNDDAGDRLTEQLTDIFDRANRSDLRLRRDRPALRGADWNDVAQKIRATCHPSKM